MPQVNEFSWSLQVFGFLPIIICVLVSISFLFFNSLRANLVSVKLGKFNLMLDL